MKNQKKSAKHAGSRGTKDSSSSSAGIRNRVIGQYRTEKKRAWESPDQQDRVSLGASNAIVRTVVKRPGLGTIAACAGCGRTHDMWEANNGEGLSKAGRRFCCKPCAIRKKCICLSIDQGKGQELNSLWRQNTRKKH